VTAAGVIPHPEDREPRRYTPTGEMDAGDGHISFGAEGDKVAVMCDGGDIVLSRTDQDLFARHLFRAMDVADLTVDGAPF
jgi:hypothetical protein